ncbi:MAG TPA: hypothetical protein VKB88_23115 [Bryobacteraceae bacterium]|nr:hypothetical protein [Bryobacteraceae bacterium]
MKTSPISRRNFLFAGVSAGLALSLTAKPGYAAEAFVGRSFTQQATHLRLYMRHYALFEEPDPGVPPAIYIDAATGMPTEELILIPPCESIAFTPAGPNPTEYTAAPPTSFSQLPYVVSPPGFPPMPAPAQVTAAIQSVLGGTVNLAAIAANTNPLLVAMGSFQPAPGTIQAQLAGGRFAVTRDVEFQVRVRIGFLFQPPQGVAMPNVGILTGWLTRGLVDQLIGSQPGGNAGDVVVYDWRTTMTLSTENRYIRSTASEPPPVADAFPAGLDAIQFLGSPVDHAGRYTIVGSASQVPFQAPPELVQFLFGTAVLTDVEFAIEESGVLVFS